MGDDERSQHSDMWLVELGQQWRAHIPIPLLPPALTQPAVPAASQRV